MFTYGELFTVTFVLSNICCKLSADNENRVFGLNTSNITADFPFMQFINAKHKLQESILTNNVSGY